MRSEKTGNREEKEREKANSFDRGTPGMKRAWLDRRGVSFRRHFESKSSLANELRSRVKTTAEGNRGENREKEGRITSSSPGRIDDGVGEERGFRDFHAALLREMIHSRERQERSCPGNLWKRS